MASRRKKSRARAARMKVRIANPSPVKRRRRRRARKRADVVAPKIVRRPKRRRARVRTQKRRARRKEIATMAKRRRRHRKKNPPTHRKRHRRHRRRNPGLFAPKRKHHRRRRARRRNPGMPPIVRTVAGVAVGAGAGAGVAYALDKMGIGTPMQRNVGMIALGAVSALILGRISPMAALAVGGGVAGVGATRALASSTAAPALPVAGLGTGEGVDDSMEGPFDQIGLVTPGGINGVFDGTADVDGIGYVVNDYG